jgi:polar amino acid transport system substrate-binding protein
MLLGPGQAIPPTVDAAHSCPSRRRFPAVHQSPQEAAVFPCSPSFRRRWRRHVLGAGAAALALAAGGCANPPLNDTAASDASPVPTVKADSKLNALVPAKYRKAGKVNVATNAPYAPYEMFVSPGSKKLTGLEIDLGRAVGQRLGVPFVFSQHPFDGLFPGLKAGKYDLLMAAFFDTKERQKTVDFVDYGRSGSALMVLKGQASGVATLDDLCGVEVAAQRGSAQVTLLKKQSSTCTKAGKPAVQVKMFPQFSDAQLALKIGKVQVGTGDVPALGYAVEKGGASEFQLLKDPDAPNGYQSSLTGIGVPKDEPELRDAIRRAIQSLMDDGTYKKILDKYGASGIAIDKAGINQGKV